MDNLSPNSNVGSVPGAQPVTPLPGTVPQPQAPPVVPTPTATVVSPNTSSSSRFDIKKWGFRIALLIGFLIIIYELIFVVWPFVKNYQSGGQSGGVGSDAQMAKMLFSADKPEYTVGESISVRVVIDSGKSSLQSADAVIKYDPQFIEPSSVTVGNIFSNYPLSELLTDVSQVKISGTNGLSSSGFSGVGDLATVVFIAKKPGLAKVSFEYTKNNTTDSNIIGLNSTSDLLEKVEDLTFNIK